MSLSTSLSLCVSLYQSLRLTPSLCVYGSLVSLPFSFFMVVCPSVPVDMSLGPSPWGVCLCRSLRLFCVSVFVCLSARRLCLCGSMSLYLHLWVSVPSPRACRAPPLPELSPVRARGRVQAVGCWAPTETQEPAGRGRRETGRGDVPSPGPPPRPRSLCRPLPPRRDRGGLCRGRSAASRHLLPLGRRLLRGPGPLARSLVRSAARAWGSAGLGCVRLDSAGLGQARPGSAGSKNSEKPRLLGGRQPAACGGRSHPYAVAVIELAGRAKLPCNWSCFGERTGPPLVPDEGREREEG